MFGKIKLGCCFGCFAGFCAVFLLFFLLGFGIYCWFVPETWDRTVQAIERIWGSAKDKGDQGWNKVKESGDQLVASVPRNGTDADQPVTIPEPEVKK